jgi:hypothetical protein
MRRTGGTTAAALLATLSEHPGVPHEPFNPERRFGDVTKHWHAHKDVAALNENMAQVLAPRPVIKHCYELVAPEVNRALIEVSSALGYRHIILDRDAEVDSVLSLELAQITGAWGSKDAKRIYREIEEGVRECDPINIPRALHQLHICQNRRLELAALLTAQEHAPFVVYFEEMYSDPDAGRKRIGQLLDFLKISPDDPVEYNKLLTNALLHQGQNSARIMAAVPNIKDAHAQLEKKAEEMTFRFLTTEIA